MAESFGLTPQTCLSYGMVVVNTQNFSSSSNTTDEVNVTFSISQSTKIFMLHANSLYFWKAYCIVLSPITISTNSDVNSLGFLIMKSANDSVISDTDVTSSNGWIRVEYTASTRTLSIITRGNQSLNYTQRVDGVIFEFA